jgi:dynein heavy chain
LQTTVIFANVCRGLFEKDKDLFAFILASSILRESGAISPAEWSLFLVGVGVAPRGEALPKNPWPERITPKQWAIAVAAQVACPHDARWLSCHFFTFS